MERLLRYGNIPSKDLQKDIYQWVISFWAPSHFPPPAKLHLKKNTMKLIMVDNLLSFAVWTCSTATASSRWAWGMPPSSPSPTAGPSSTLPLNLMNTMSYLLIPSPYNFLKASLWHMRRQIVRRLSMHQTLTRAPAITSGPACSKLNSSESSTWTAHHRQERMLVQPVSRKDPERNWYS